jgi:uncharacterized protein YndB with AHSA1/START domain
MANIKHFLIIDAPIKTVYSAVTEQQGLSGWWTSRTIAKPEIGFINEFRFDNDYHNKMKVTKLEQYKLVCWDCVGGDREWIGTNLRFDLTENNGKTELMFTHENWAAETLFFGNCSFHWAGYMKSLRDHCEKGKGIPNHNGRF